MMASFRDNRQDCGFCCHGEASFNDLHKGLLLNIGNYLSNFEMKGNEQQTTMPTFNIYGATHPTSSIFNKDFLNHLIMFSKREILSLKCSALQWHSVTRKTFIDSGVDARYHSLDIHRQNVLKFLSTLKSCLTESYFVDSVEILENDLVSQIVNNLKEILLCSGRISIIPDYMVQNAIKDSLGTSASHQYFHLLIEIWWLVLSCLWNIQETLTNLQGVQMPEIFLIEKSGLPSNFNESYTSQVTLLLMWDLTLLAYKKFTKLQHSDYNKVVPFSCTCVRQLWFLLIQFLNGRNENLDFFWVYWLYISQDILSNSTDEIEYDSVPLTKFSAKPVSSPFQSGPQFCLWMLRHISELFRVDEKGVYKPGIKVQSNYMELNKIVELILSGLDHDIHNKRRSSSKVEDLEFVLSSCLALSDLWEPNIEVLLLLTDFFLKNLNQISGTSSTTINYQISISKSGLHWYSKLSEFQDMKVSNENSFQLYLCLLGIHFSQITPQVKKLSAQRRLTSKIYPKINEKWIRELSVSGFEKFFSLLLTLGIVGSQKDIAQKLCAMSRMVPISSLAKKTVCWKALFTCIHCQFEKSEDTNLLCKTLNQQFTSVFEQYNSTTLHLNELSNHELMGLILVYLEEMRDVFICSPSLTLSEHFLLSDTISKLLPKCGFSELAAALNSVEQVILQLQKLQQDGCLNLNSDKDNQHNELLNKIERFVLPFITMHAKTQTPPKSVSNVAVGLTFLYLESDWDKSISLVNEFSLNPKINSMVSSAYLCHVLANKDLVYKLNEKQQDSTLGIWLRSSLIKPDVPKTQFETLTRLVFDLPRIKGFFPNPLEKLNQTDSETEVNIQSLVICFFHETYLHWEVNLQNWKAKSDFRSRLLDVLQLFVNDIKNCINPKDGTYSNAETVQQIFTLSSYLVLHLGPILYNPENPGSILPVILDNTILSLYLLKDKQVPDGILVACRQTLHRFIIALINLGFEEDKHRYISRRIKEIIYIYVPRFPIKKGHLNHNHFLLDVLFHQSSIKPLHNVDGLFKFIMETVYDRFLLKKGSEKSPHFQIGTTLLLEVLEISSGANKTWLSSKVLSSLLEHLISNNVDSRIFSLLQQTLNTIVKGLGYDSARLIISQCLNTFIAKHLAWNSKIVFQLLDDISGIADCSIMIEILPTLTRNIEIIEEKRGVGVDQILRKGLERFHQNLNNNSKR